MLEVRDGMFRTFRVDLNIFESQIRLRLYISLAFRIRINRQRVRDCQTVRYQI